MDNYLIIMLWVCVITSITSVFISRKKLKSDYSPEKLKLDITIEQMMDLENKVSLFLGQANISPECSIWDIAKKLNVQVGGISKDQKTQAFLQKTPQGGMIVTFSKGLSREERVFAFAHECAHLVNKDNIPATRPNGRNKPLEEQLADYTAAALLMPINSVYDILERSNYLHVSTRKKVAVIKLLCKKYQVSDALVIRRIQEVYALKQF